MTNAVSTVSVNAIIWARMEVVQQLALAVARAPTHAKRLVDSMVMHMLEQTVATLKKVVTALQMNQAHSLSKITVVGLGRVAREMDRLEVMFSSETTLAMPTMPAFTMDGKVAMSTSVMAAVMGTMRAVRFSNRRRLLPFQLVMALATVQIVAGACKLAIVLRITRAISWVTMNVVEMRLHEDPCCSPSSSIPYYFFTLVVL